jgi:hypothetical protein
MAKAKQQFSTVPAPAGLGGYGSGFVAYGKAGCWTNNRLILRTFMASLTEIARKGVPGLNADERTKLIVHDNLLVQSIDALLQMLDAKSVRAQEDFAYQLLQVVRSTSLIASFTAASPVTLRKMLQQIERGVAGTKTKSRLIDEVIAELVDPILLKYPTWKTGRIVDPLFVDQVNKKLKERELPPMKRQAIAKRVAKRINKFRTAIYPPAP